MYTPLYIKSNYTFLSSLVKIDDLVKKCVDNNIKQVALCDDNLIGAMYFYKECIKNNIKPIIGIDYKINDSNVLLYAKDFLGYQNILKIVSNENVDLNNYNKNVLCVIPFKNNNLYSDMKVIFSYCYLGVSNKDEEIESLKITKDVVFLNKVLYLSRKEEKYFKYVLMMRDKLNVFDNVEFNDDLNYLLKEEDIISLVSKKTLDNTNKFGDMCNLEINKKENVIPKYKNNFNLTSEEYLTNLSMKGLEIRLKDKLNDSYKKRLSYELSVINKMGFADYFLIVYDFVKYAKKSDILVGPGRGSAAGSLVAYSLGIIDIDPLKYDLYFERFLNSGRITMPDIDVDFPDIYRDQVKVYVKDKYGEKNVAGIMAVGSLKARAVIDDVARILKTPLDKVSRIKKYIGDKDKLKDVYNNTELKNIIDNDDTLKKLFDLSVYFEGFPKNTSVHASGVVISEDELDDIIPIVKHDDFYISSYEGKFLEELGLLKMDFLGNANLTIIMNTLDMIKEKENIKVDFNNIPLGDKETLKIFYDIDTNGIFQFESDVMKNLLRRLKVTSFNDIISAISLVRPGPDTKTYIERKNSNIKVNYPNKEIEKILKPTYGVLVYQEQVMEIAKTLASFSLSEADILRSAMSKKKKDLLEKYKEKFISGGLKNGYSYELLNKYYNDILAFSEYGFNKAHAVSYATVAYKMAYLKAHYPKYFYTSLLSLSKGDNKNILIIKEARKRGIKFYLPDINKSTNKYEILDDGLLLPLTSIKGLTEDTALKIIKERDKQFENIFEVLVKLSELDIKRNVIESLIYASCFDIFGYSKKTLIENLDNLLNYSYIAKGIDRDIIDPPKIEEKDEYDLVFLLNKEKELFGMYLKYHPTNMYKEKYKVIDLNNLNNYVDKLVNVVVLIEKVKTITDKKGNQMAFLRGSDELSSVDITCFSKAYQEMNDVKVGNILLVEGKVEKREDYQIILDKCKILN